jgi:hypothetical protein
MRRPPRYTLLTTILVLAVFASLVTLWFSGVLKSRQKFDKQVWATADPDHSNIRFEMLDDLFANHRFKELNRSGVVALLGEPEEPGIPGWDIAYLLGRERNWVVRLDNEWLVIRFGQDGYVADMLILRL